MQDKLNYVEEVIALLEMEGYSGAVVGVPGEGLNVEQRKRLTIGVELAAKPDLLIFLDEPTSGLDSQTAWSISTLLRKLADHGQAVLCTIHQPSAMLFQQFDRLLLLAKGGRTVYFGDIGENSRTMVDYFERHGAEPCASEANPAEWMLHVIGAAPGSTAICDWHETWKLSPEFAQIRNELEWLETSNVDPLPQAETTQQQYAAPFHTQVLLCTKRVFEQYWRTPSYLYSKLILCFGTVSSPSMQYEARDLTFFPGIIYRSLLPADRSNPDGSPASDVRHIHVVGNFRLPGIPDHAQLYHAARSIRSKGATVQGLLVVILHAR
jgi:energy-coupling factor transporter ATP-binding protein EcfA2